MTCTHINFRLRVCVITFGVLYKKGVENPYYNNNKTRQYYHYIHIKSYKSPAGLQRRSTTVSRHFPYILLDPRRIPILGKKAFPRLINRFTAVATFRLGKGTVYTRANDTFSTRQNSLIYII